MTLLFTRQETPCVLGCGRGALVGHNKLGYCDSCFKEAFAVHPAFAKEAKAFDYKKAFGGPTPTGDRNA